MAQTTTLNLPYTMTISTTSGTELWKPPMGPISRGHTEFGYSFRYEPVIEYVMPENVRDKMAGQALKHDKTIDLTIIGAGGIL